MIPRNFAFLILSISSYLRVKFVFFLKIRPLFKSFFLLFTYVCKQTFRKLYGQITYELVGVLRRKLTAKSR